MKRETSAWSKMGRKAKTQWFESMKELASEKPATADTLDDQKPKRRGRPPKDPNAPPKKKQKTLAERMLTENYHQQVVVTYCNKLNLPFYGVPNAARRTAWEAMHAKRMGIKAGVYDLAFVHAAHGYHGFYLEMKRPDKAKAVVSPAQKAWAEIFKREGYYEAVAYGSEEALTIINWYFGIKDGRQQMS